MLDLLRPRVAASDGLFFATPACCVAPPHLVRAVPACCRRVLRDGVILTSLARSLHLIGCWQERYGCTTRHDPYIFFFFFPRVFLFVSASNARRRGPLLRAADRGVLLPGGSAADDRLREPRRARRVQRRRFGWRDRAGRGEQTHAVCVSLKSLCVCVCLLLVSVFLFLCSFRPCLYRR